MNKSIIFKIVFVVFLAYFFQLRWAPFDNQDYLRTNFGDIYYFFIIDRAWRYPLFAFLMMFSSNIYYGMKLLGPAIIVVLLFCVLSLLWSIDFSRTLSGILELMLVVGYLALALRFLGASETLRIIWFFSMAVILVSALLATIGDSHALMTSAIHAGLWRGLFNHKNVFAPFVVTILLMSIFGFKLLQIRPLVRYLSIGLCLFCLFRAGSSTSVLAFMLSVFIAQLASMKVESAQMRLIVYFLLVFPLLGFAIVGFSFFDSAVEGVGRDVTLSGRTAIWRGALPFTFEAPFGYGFRTSGGEAVLEAVRISANWPYAASVHNVYINMALDIGWPVTLVFIYAMLTRTVVIRKEELFETRRLLAGVAALHLIVGVTEVVGGIYTSVHLVVVLWGIMSINAAQSKNPSPSVTQHQLVPDTGLLPAQ